MTHRVYGTNIVVQGVTKPQEESTDGVNGTSFVDCICLETNKAGPAIMAKGAA